MIPLDSIPISPPPTISVESIGLNVCILTFRINIICCNLVHNFCSSVPIIVFYICGFLDFGFLPIAAKSGMKF